jgi:hypothetical protein
MTGQSPGSLTLGGGMQATVGGSAAEH